MWKTSEKKKKKKNWKNQKQKKKENNKTFRSEAKLSLNSRRKVYIKKKSLIPPCIKRQLHHFRSRESQAGGLRCCHRGGLWFSAKLTFLLIGGNDFSFVFVIIAFRDLFFFFCLLFTFLSLLWLLFFFVFCVYLRLLFTLFIFCFSSFFCLAFLSLIFSLSFLLSSSFSCLLFFS